jgi:dihydrofolate reductase
MRKLKYQAQVTIDGYVAGPNGELNWMDWDWDDELKAYVNELNAPIGTILLGRKMTDAFVSYWENVVTRPDHPDFGIAKLMVDTPKVVFTKTLTKSSWKNTVLATGDLADEVNRLKAQGGKTDIIVYGGAGFVSSLIGENLIDEYHLLVNPVAIGKGMRVFTNFKGQRKFTLKKATSFPCGMVGLNYEPAKG